MLSKMSYKFSLRNDAFLTWMHIEVYTLKIRWLSINQNVKIEGQYPIFWFSMNFRFSNPEAENVIKS